MSYKRIWGTKQTEQNGALKKLAFLYEKAEGIMLSFLTWKIQIGGKKKQKTQMQFYRKKKEKGREVSIFPEHLNLAYSRIMCSELYLKQEQQTLTFPLANSESQIELDLKAPLLFTFP